MNKLWFSAGLAVLALSGCTTVQQGHIPVVDSTSSASEFEPTQTYGQSYSAPAPTPSYEPTPSDSGVVVMVPTQPQVSTPLISTPLTSSIEENPAPVPIYQPTPEPSGVPRSNTLAADEQLDGPVLALLTTASQQENGGDLNGAASSLERAQRIAPREPQVLYRLAQVRLAQGDAAQAEQLARRGLSYAGGRNALQASLWELIAQSRERQGDPAGAASARQNARVNL